MSTRGERKGDWLTEGLGDTGGAMFGKGWGLGGPVTSTAAGWRGGGGGAVTVELAAAVVVGAMAVAGLRSK